MTVFFSKTNLRALADLVFNKYALVLIRLLLGAGILMMIWLLVVSCVVINKGKLLLNKSITIGILFIINWILLHITGSVNIGTILIDILL